MTWIVVLLLGVIAIALVFFMSFVGGYMACMNQIKDREPDLFWAYLERRKMKEEWQDGESNGSAG